MVGNDEGILMDRYPKLLYQEGTRSFRVTLGKKLYGWVWGYEDEWHCENVYGVSWAADTLNGALSCLIDP